MFADEFAKAEDKGGGEGGDGYPADVLAFWV